MNRKDMWVGKRVLVNGGNGILYKLDWDGHGPTPGWHEVIKIRPRTAATELVSRNPEGWVATQLSHHSSKSIVESRDQFFNVPVTEKGLEETFLNELRTKELQTELIKESVAELQKQIREIVTDECEQLSSLTERKIGYATAYGDHSREEFNRYFIEKTNMTQILDPKQHMMSTPILGVLIPIDIYLELVKPLILEKFKGDLL